MSKTAMHELIEFINAMKVTQTLLNGCDIETVHIPSLLHKATELLEKERADHKFSYEQGRIDFSCELDNGSDEIESPSFKNFEDYFTQTYKQ